MAAQITYLSEAALQNKFDRNLQDRAELSFGFDADFQVESYLAYQGEKFCLQYDANSYLYISKAMDLFDLNPEGGSTSIWYSKSCCSKRSRQGMETCRT